MEKEYLEKFSAVKVTADKDLNFEPYQSFWLSFALFFFFGFWVLAMLKVWGGLW